jgi:hypothetical protein
MIFSQQCAKAKRDNRTEAERLAIAEKLAEYKQVRTPVTGLMLCLFLVSSFTLHVAGSLCSSREQKQEAQG